MIVKIKIINTKGNDSKKAGTLITKAKVKLDEAISNSIKMSELNRFI